MSRFPETGFGSERIRLGAPLAAGEQSWWSGYERSLAASGIGDVSRKVIKADAEHIVRRGILGAGAPGDGGWPEGRVRTGAVMGAVQSGKTASMMAVTALALDAGVNAVVLLAGTRTALWLQTAERLVEQLDVLPHKATRRYLLPSPTAMAAAGGLDAGSAYRFSAQQADRALQKSRPLVAVVMKNVAHLASMADALHSVVYPSVYRAGEPFHLLVIDDEADDSTVVDEHETDPAKARQVPRRVRDLWESRQSQLATVSPHVFATYVAYTATPQANILQDSENPLAPRHFFASLRTPGAEGDWQQRTSTYRVPEGARAWYTGGKVFYEQLADVPLCVDVSEDTEREAADNLIDSIRAYLVACAVRLFEQPSALGPAAARGKLFSSRAEARSSVVKPMSMLVHPSPAMLDHFEAAARILAWSHGGEADQGQALLRAGTRALSATGVVLDIEQDESRWLRWLDSYRDAARIAAAKLELSPAPQVPEADQWPALREVLLSEVVPGTSVAVINSDEQADDRPRFSPVQVDEGAWSPAPSLSTIFVSGNVMSRGLTLEGLTTTLFSRRSHEPLADTQMQMQRWFGYRGAHIHLCRVFMTQEQRLLFSHYHQNDEALRRDVLAAMAQDPSGRPPLTVLQGKSFLATGKINRLRSVPLWPGPKPFVRLMNDPGEDADNLKLVASLFGDADVLRVPAASGRQGLVLAETRSLLETAEVLDRLRYVEHCPGLDGVAAARWASVEAHAGLPSQGERSGLYRPPAQRSGGLDLGAASPYWIAAYLRLWDAAVDRRIPGMYTTGEPSAPWSLLNLSEKRSEMPRFSIGVRFGSGAVVNEELLDRLPVPATGMEREVEGRYLKGAWGSRGRGPSGIRGDETFDLRARGLAELAADEPRPPGSDGQVLFHLVARPGGAVTVAVGVVIPLGGPDNLEARRNATS